MEISITPIDFVKSIKKTIDYKLSSSDVYSHLILQGSAKELYKLIVKYISNFPKSKAEKSTIDEWEEALKIALTTLRMDIPSLTMEARKFYKDYCSIKNASIKVALVSLLDFKDIYRLSIHKKAIQYN